MAGEEIAQTIAANAMNSASNIAGYQVTRLVDMCIDGLLNVLMNPSKEDKLKEIADHHDHLLEIINKNKLLPQRAPMMSPRESVERDIRESNAHINTAITELERAREQSKCGVCKSTLTETIDLVSEKTGEILDVSEKILALQRLKEGGEIPSNLSWYDLNRKQKKLVEERVNIYHQINNPRELEMPDGENSPNVLSVRRIDDDKNKKQARRAPRKTTGRKQKA
jgi:hypothetical protein